MNTPEEAVQNQLSIFTEENWSALFECLHSDVKSALRPIFERIRKEQDSGLPDAEIFSELFGEYSGDDFTEKEFELIGITYESESIAHAVIRVLDSSYPLETSWVETLSFAKENMKWKGMLTTYFVANLLTQYETA